MRSIRLPLLVGAAACAVSIVVPSPLGAQGTPPAGAATHQIVSGKTITWGPAPGSMPGGAQLAVLYGDPGKEGAFTIRLKLPNAFKVPAHWHPTDEHITIIQGTFLLGHGEKYDVAGLKPMMAGDYAFMPKEIRHFGLIKGETIVQVSGMGPFVINYVNPEDDPRTKKTSSNP